MDLCEIKSCLLYNVFALAGFDVNISTFEERIYFYTCFNVCLYARLWKMDVFAFK